MVAFLFGVCMIPDLTRVFVPVTVKSDPGNPGVRIVSGLATDPTLDSDRQICDPNWLEKAMPVYERWGNIREMHQPIAAGVATSIIQEGDAFYVTSKIIDQGTCAKLDAGVLKGYSIGIAHPQVIRDTKAIGGRIVGGEIIEISLVDRPANPNALIDSVEFAEKMEKVFLLPAITKDESSEVADAGLALQAANLVRQLMIAELTEGAEAGEDIGYTMGTLTCIYDALLSISREEAMEAWQYMAAGAVAQMKNQGADMPDIEGKTLLADLEKALSKADSETLRAAHDMLATVTKSADMCTDFSAKFAADVDAANKAAETGDEGETKEETPDLEKSGTETEEPAGTETPAESEPAGEPESNVEDIVKRLIDTHDSELRTQLDAATTKVAELEAKLTELGNEPDDSEDPLLGRIVTAVNKSRSNPRLAEMKAKVVELDGIATTHPAAQIRLKAMGQLRRLKAEIKEIEGNV